MSISSAVSRVQYTGDGATSIYAYPFVIQAAADLLVTVRNSTTNVETTLVLNTDYTVSGIGVTTGGNATLLGSFAPLTSGHVIAIRRAPQLTQSTDIRNQNEYLPEIHENALDRQVMLDQKQQDELDRSIKIMETETGTPLKVTLPSVAGRASKVLGFDASGNAIAISNVPTSGVPATAYIQTLLDDPDAATARATLGVTVSAPSAYIDTLLDDPNALTARTTLKISGEVSPASFASNQNDYAGANIDFAVTLARLTSSNPVNITGFTGGVAGKVMTIYNAGTFDITLLNENAFSLAANRIVTQFNATFLIRAGRSCTLEYDATNSRWRVISLVPGSLIHSIKTFSLTLTENEDVVMLDATTGAFTVTLPAAGLVVGKVFFLKKIDSTSNALTIDPNLAELIDEKSTIVLSAPHHSLHVVSTGLGWRRLDRVVQNSEVHVHTGNGYGSVNNKIRRFTTIQKNIGTAITYADSSTLGTSFTINEDGVYAMSYTDDHATTMTMGVSVNTTQGNTNIQDIAVATRVVQHNIATGAFSTVSVTTRLSVGDVIRPHSDGNGVGVTNRVSFRIVKISD